MLKSHNVTITTSTLFHKSNDCPVISTERAFSPEHSRRESERRDLSRQVISVFVTLKLLVKCGAGKALPAILISFILLSCSCQSKLQCDNSAPVTALLGAFNREVELLEDQLTDASVQRIEGMRFVTGKLTGENVVVAWTGIGKVNAAMTTTLLLEHFKPREVIFTGIAGAANPQLHPGDIVIAEKTAHHDMGRLTADGFVPRGVMNPLDAWRNPVFLPADRRLLKLAEAAGKQVDLEPIETAAGQRAPKIVTGIVVTGDVFVASSEKCAQLRQQFGADAVELEGAAVAQICYQREVPHIIIRSISDRADEEALYDARVFQYLAARNSSALILEIVALLDSELSVEKPTDLR